MGPSEPAAFLDLFALADGVEDPDLVLIPVPWDATTSYRSGTHRAPAAIAAAGCQVDLLDATLGPRPEPRIAMLPVPAGILELNARARAGAVEIIERVGRIEGDPRLAGVLEEVNAASRSVDDWVREQAAEQLAAGRVVGVVGGDHSCPLGAIREIGAREGPFGILHLDAHADLRRAYEGFSGSHASIMDNVLETVPQVERLVQVGIRDFCQEEFDRIRESGGRVKTFFDADLARSQFEGTPFDSLARTVVEELPRKVYLSFDIDGLEPSACPNTGTPVPGGLSFNQAVHLVTTVVRSGRTIVGFDLCEVAPGAGGNDLDVITGTRLLYKMSLWCLASRGR